MKYSGAWLTKQFEQCRLTPYQDSAGVWTDGWGNTHGVVPGVSITQEKADADLDRNLSTAIAAVNLYVTILLTQEEFDACVDLVFNIGTGAFAHSTLLRKLNAMDIDGAADQFLVWDMAGGKHLAGLLRRRKAEKDLFEGQRLIP